MSFFRTVFALSIFLGVLGTGRSALGQITPLAAQDPSASGPHHHHTPGHHDQHHQRLNVPAAAAVPLVTLFLHADAVKGWNLEVQVENFRFAPERVNTESLVHEGHGHLYINGKKITRIYGPWYYLPTLEPGAKIRVSLHGNGHEALAINDQPIEAQLIHSKGEHHAHP